MDFKLPKELIAQKPAHPRDHARLLVYNRRTKLITDDVFYNVGAYLRYGSTIVVNNSKVEKARLKFTENTELFVVEVVNPTTVQALVFPGKKYQLGDVEIGGIKMKVTNIAPDGIRTIELDRPIDDPSLDHYRLTPFPPYIKQDESLAAEYQTVFAKPIGSKASPTAGLHFTERLLSEIRQTHEIAEITLHVGLGTFAPLRPENIMTRKLHEEWYQIDETAADTLNRAGKITAVGTTTVRTLESAVEMPETGSRHRLFKPKTGKTDIFIQPGYTFKSVDSFITNFHLPGTSLLMLVEAFVGSQAELKEIYQHAISERYRFYSFGDAMLIL